MRMQQTKSKHPVKLKTNPCLVHTVKETALLKYAFYNIHGLVNSCSYWYVAEFDGGMDGVWKEN